MATNLIRRDVNGLSVVCSHPAAPDSGDPVRVNQMTGVALTDEGDGGNAATETTVDFGPRVYDLSVKAVNDSGNSAVAFGDQLYYVDADTPVLSKKASGYFFGFALEAISSGATDTINVLILPSPGPGTADILAGAVGTSELAADAVDGTKIADDSIDSEHYVDGSIDTAHLAADVVDGTKIADGAVSAEHLDTVLKTGFIPLDITSLREISSNDIANISDTPLTSDPAGFGGLLAKNTTPILERVNGATDKAIRVSWAATVVDEVAFPPVPMPQDLDAATDVTIHVLAAMGGATDTPTLDVQCFDGVGDTEMGGATGAITGTAVAEYSVTIANANISGPPTGFFNIALVPAAHGNDALYLYAAWIEYTRA